MYNDLFLEMMRLMGTTGQETLRASKKITKANIERFISICLAHGVNTYTVEEMILANSKFSSGKIIDHLESYLEGTKIQPGMPLEYKGIRYESQEQLAAENGMSPSTVRYQISKGLITKLEE